MWHYCTYLRILEIFRSWGAFPIVNVNLGTQKIFRSRERWKGTQHFLWDRRNLIDLSVSFSQIALVYSEAVVSRALQLQGGPLLQQTFLLALSKQIDHILDATFFQSKGGWLRNDLQTYLKNFIGEDGWKNIKDPFLVSQYLRWYDIPRPSLIRNGLDQLLGCLPFLSSISTDTASLLPFLALLFPGSATKALTQICPLLCSSSWTF